MTAGSWHGWRGREWVERVDRPPITTDRLWAQHAEEWRCVVPEAFMGNDFWLAGKRQQCTALLTCSGSLATCRSCGWWEQTGRYGRVLREIWLLTCVTEIWLKALMNGVRGAMQNRIRSNSEVFFLLKDNIWLWPLQPRSSLTEVISPPPTNSSRSFCSPLWSCYKSLLHHISLCW